MGIAKADNTQINNKLKSDGGGVELNILILFVALRCF